jgi:hypothetical protein
MDVLTGRYPASLAPSSMASGGNQAEPEPRPSMTAPGSPSTVARFPWLATVPSDPPSSGTMATPVPVGYPPRAGEHAKVTDPARTAPKWTGWSGAGGGEHFGVQPWTET